ncbi:MAG TPA: isoamylase early set domain-containing protein [Gemmatimonadales bacterium]|nr:isoamylase early set domain-containing protein [Gemmatimonadales bacterium]
MNAYDPLVKQLLDGELTLAELPPELQAEASEALRLLAAVDRRAVMLPETLDARVMDAVRTRARAVSLTRRSLGWITEPWELRLRVRPWALGAALAAAAALVLVLRGPGGTISKQGPAATASALPESLLVRFVLYAPGAKQVGLAGTFNQWNQSATPLVRASSDGVWTVTLTLPAGQHQYGFVVDGRRWVTDPAAPAVDDGFGRRNSVIAVGGTVRAGRVL